MMWTELVEAEHDGKFVCANIDGMPYTGILIWMTPKGTRKRSVRLWTSSLNSIAPAGEVVAAKTSVELLP